VSSYSFDVKNREQIDCRPLKGQQGADS